MSEVVQNTLYVLSEGAYIRRDREVIRVEVERKTRLEVPCHLVESIAVFGRAMVSPGLLAMCAEAGIPVSFLSESGRFLARVDAPRSGGVVLRRAQHRTADDAAKSLAIARNMVAGKLNNTRNLLLRLAREGEGGEGLAAAAERIAALLGGLERARSANEVRGIEGDAARSHFGALPAALRQNRDFFSFEGRSKHPPRDPFNALLSFLYALLRHDCVSALHVAGLDPYIGFLHTDRPGRESLALDLMAEFRPLVADRLALTLVNRREATPDGFEKRDGGSVRMTDATRRKVVAAYQQRKREEVTHPLLDQKTTVGRLPFLQARLLARCVRGDVAEYPPCVMK